MVLAAELVAQVRLFRTNRGRNCCPDVHQDDECDDNAAACNRDTETHERCPEIERVPHETIRTRSRDFAALFEMPGGPDSNRLPDRRNRGTEQQRRPRGTSEPQDERPQDKTEWDSPARNALGYSGALTRIVHSRATDEA